MSFYTQSRAIASSRLELPYTVGVGWTPQNACCNALQRVASTQDNPWAMIKSGASSSGSLSRWRRFEHSSWRWAPSPCPILMIRSQAFRNHAPRIVPPASTSITNAFVACHHRATSQVSGTEPPGSPPARSFSTYCSSTRAFLLLSSAWESHLMCYSSPTSNHSSSSNVINGRSSSTSWPGSYSKTACVSCPMARKTVPTGRSAGQSLVHIPQPTHDSTM